MKLGKSPRPWCKRTVWGGFLTVCLCVWGGQAKTAAEDGVVRIRSRAEPITQAGYVSFNHRAIQYELQRPSPYSGYGGGNRYDMPQRHHPVDRWYYVRRALGLDQNKTPYPRVQYNYGHGVSSSRLTPISRVFR